MAILAVSPVIGGVIGIVWLSIMKRYADSIIKITMGLNVVMLSIAAIVAWINGIILLAILYIIILGFSVIYYIAVRNRIPFAQATISVSVDAINENPGPIYLTYGMAVFQIIWIVFWAFTTLSIYHHYENSSVSTSLRGFIYFLLLISLYWTQQVLKNIAHVVTAGVVASWWLDPANLSPTIGAFTRAITTSLGSICFGSFIVAFLEATRAIVRMAKSAATRNNNIVVAILLCLIECWLGILERMIRYFNKYAFTQVAIYGKDFITAAKDTWDLFKHRGFEMLINDNLTGMVLFMGCVIGGAITGLIGGLWAYSFDHSNDVWLPVGIVCFIIGYFMVLLTMTVIESAVATTYVVLAEDPAVMGRNRPAEYTRLQTAAAAAYPGLVL